MESGSGKFKFEVRYFEDIQTVLKTKEDFETRLVK